jgi:hypothetical protein
MLILTWILEEVGVKMLNGLNYFGICSDFLFWLLNDEHSDFIKLGNFSIAQKNISFSSKSGVSGSKIVC